MSVWFTTPPWSTCHVTKCRGRGSVITEGGNDARKLSTVQAGLDYAQGGTTVSQLSTIAVLGGTGQQGRRLAQRLGLSRLAIAAGARDPVRARAAVSNWATNGPPIDVDTNAAAVARADIVVLTIPFSSVAPLLDDVRSHFTAGALAIDVTVPVTFAGGKMALIDVPEGSAAEYVRARLPEHVSLAGTFKTLPAHVLDDLGQS